MTQKNAKLSQQVVGKLALQGARNLIWDQIIMEADKFRPHLDIIEHQEIAMGEAKKQAHIVSAEVNKRPLVTMENAITFLSTLSNGSASKYRIQNRVAIVSRARKVVAKHRMMETVRAEIEVTERKFREVVKLFRQMLSRGILFFWEEKGPLMSHKEYQECLVHCRLDHNKFGDMQQALSRKVVFDKLASDFELLFDFKAACSKVPKISYPETMELQVQAYNMMVVTMPGPDLWRVIQQYGSPKLKVHS